MKIVFMGTPVFASEALEAIIAHGDEVALVVTRADKPKGRGYEMTPSQVKVCAEKHNIPVITPQTLRDEAVQKTLADVNADVFIVAAYGRILPPEVLAIPPMGCVNIHASLLPSLRGAAPINRAVMRGDTSGGITIMYMDAGIDTGDIIFSKSIDIPHGMNAGEYHDALCALARECICEYLDKASRGAVAHVKQPEAGVSYADKIDKAETHIDFSRPHSEVYNIIRGLAPSPCAYTVINGKRIKLCKASEGNASGTPGTVVSLSNGLEIACLNGSVIITELQPEGKQKMSASDFLRGAQIHEGDITA